MISYSNIPVEVEGELKRFDYNYIDRAGGNRLCTVSSEGKTLVIDDDYNLLCTDMPVEWVDPSIDALKMLVNPEGETAAQRTPERGGFLTKVKQFYARMAPYKKPEQFLNVPVKINGQVQLFNFELLKDEDGRLWIANSKLKTLYIQENFDYDNFIMPEDWIQPAIDALKKLLQG